jgi:predicted HTH transcriptional regulator
MAETKSKKNNKNVEEIHEMIQEEYRKHGHVAYPYAILPFKLRRDSNLTPISKLIYAEIQTCLEECTNEYLQNALGISESEVKKSLKQLSERQHIKIEHVNKQRKIIVLGLP